MFYLVKQIIQSPLDCIKANKNELVIIMWLFIPIAAVILFNSVLYSGWRHIYFIYPAIILIALMGYQNLADYIKEKSTPLHRIIINSIIIGLVSLNLLGIIRFMIQSHPYQHEYFNMLVGGQKGAENKFEMDYWGLTYRRALEYILEKDQQQKIMVYSDDDIGIRNKDILRKADRDRIKYVKKPEAAQYLLKHYWSRNQAYLKANEIYAISINKIKLMTVYKQEINIANIDLDLLRAQTELIKRNQAYTAEKTSEEIVNNIKGDIKNIINKYLKAVNDLEIKIECLSRLELSSGRINSLNMRIDEGLMGDFEHNDLGIPLQTLSLTISDVLQDLEKMVQGELEPFSIERLSVNELILKAADVNHALKNAEGEEKNLRVNFDKGMVKVKWLGRLKAEMNVNLMIKPDPIITDSDNLWFEIKSFKVMGIHFPGRLIQWIIDEYNPIIQLDKIKGKLHLGELEIDNGVFNLGIK